MRKAEASKVREASMWSVLVFLAGVIFLMKGSADITKESQARKRQLRREARRNAEHRRREQMQALVMIHEALSAVEDAVEAIENFADVHDIELQHERSKVTVHELARVVHELTGQKYDCVERVLEVAFDVIEECELTILKVKDDED